MVGNSRAITRDQNDAKVQRQVKTTKATKGKVTMPILRKKKVDENSALANLKSEKVVGEKAKRVSQNSPKDAPAKKRSAFGDITNAGQRQIPLGGKKPKPALISNTKENIPNKTGVGRRTRSQEKVQRVDVIEILDDSIDTSKDKSANSSSFDNISITSLLSEGEICKLSNDGLVSSQEFTTSSRDTSTEKLVEPETIKEEKSNQVQVPCIIPEETKTLPEGVRDVDTDPDPFSVSEYAESIFRNMKRRERLFPVTKYMEGRTNLTPSMRAILIDWIVEVQENFELYHETMYLAIRILDLFLQSKSDIKKDNLQLIGVTALLIASKIEERYPPPLDDFVYICDDAYRSTDIIKTEMEVLAALKFELGIPISYRFLRRYSRVAGADMETLTLARYILESSLIHYEFVDCSQSKIAAAALNLAFRMKDYGEWDATLVYHTGYTDEQLKELVIRLNKMICKQPASHLMNVHSKYSHPVFSEVAKIPTITIEE